MWGSCTCTYLTRSFSILLYIHEDPSVTHHRLPYGNSATFPPWALPSAYPDMATEADFARIGNYARMYNPDQGIDRHKCTREVPLEVLSLGYSRTGTMSMHKALEILGYPSPYHFSTFYDNIQDCDIWIELMTAKFQGNGPISKKQFDQVLGHCGAVTDIPCILFAAELIEYYPEAKVVLVERDIERWFTSWSKFLDEALGNPIMYNVAQLDPDYVGKIVRVGGEGTKLLVGNAETRAAAKARSREQYRKHYAFIRSMVAQDRILNYDLSTGWEPLCKFLGKSVPDMPFPNLNESASNKESFKEIVGIGLRRFMKQG